MKNRSYQIVETMGTLKRDRTSYGYQFYIESLAAEVLIQDGYDFTPHENKLVKVIIMIEEDK